MTQLSPVQIPRDQHPVSRKLISDNALKVMHRLNSNGFQAYLVGGGVRDILLGNAPKDFDIATDAHPEEVHALFKNSRLIGRRFKLVHILFGREMIEVATFRGNAADLEQPPEEQLQHQSEHGMLLRDNVYGTMDEDAIRRDFTINALYYCPKDFCLYDFVDGKSDLENRRLKLIGDPESRYREDPVRMLRAVRFASKLGFEIESKTAEPIYELATLLNNVAAARLFDEVLKLFLSGSAQAIFSDLRKYGLFAALFPEIDHTLNRADNREQYLQFLNAAFRNTDARIKVDKPVTPAFLYAALLWPEIDRLWQQRLAKGESAFPALQAAYTRVLQEQLKYVSIPKRFTLMMKEIWEFQIRLTKTQGRAPKQLIQQPRFRASYDFLLLREESGAQPGNLGKFWTQFQKDNPVAPSTANKNRDGGPLTRKRRRNPGRRR